MESFIFVKFLIMYITGNDASNVLWLIAGNSIFGSFKVETKGKQIFKFVSEQINYK